MINKKLLMLLFMMWFSLHLMADVTMHGIFRTNMVLQRDMKVAIFGNASNGESITVQFNGQTKSTVTSNGKWKVFLDAMSAGGPYTLTVSGNNTLTFTEVMVGEVWLLSGQSNIAARIGDFGYTDATKDFLYPNLRHYDMGWNDVGWMGATGWNNQWFSALGFYFGMNLHTMKNIPVGLVKGAVVSTPIEKWLDPTSISQNGDIDLSNNPGEHYNNLIAPIVGFTFRGCVWDQGENNSGGDGPKYRRYLTSMINNWRTNFGNEMYFSVDAMPWVSGQYVTMQSHPVETGSDAWYAETRQAENDILSIKNTAVITTVDIADGDIHPNNKPEKGRRLALAARGMALHENVEYSGPMFDYMEQNGNTLILHFLHIGDGLEINGSSLEGMAIAGADNVFYWANGYVNGSTLVINSPSVSNPTQARYTWATQTNPKGNFRNKNGIGCNTFRSDGGFRPYESANGQYNNGTTGGNNGGGGTPSIDLFDQPGTLTAQGENSPNETKDKAIDNSSGTKWLDFANGSASTRSSWIQYQLSGTTKFVVNQYTITSANDAPERDPKSWTLLASNDGSSWSTVDTKTNESFANRGQKNTYSISNTTAYSYYKLQINSVNNPSTANSMQVAEIEMFGQTGSNTGTTSGIENNAIYEIESVGAPGKGLDVGGVATADGSQVQIWDYVSGANQKWKTVDAGGGYYTLIPQHATSSALDVSNGSSTNGAKIQIWSSNGSNAQKWKFTDAGNGQYGIQPACAPSSGLDVAAFGTTNGSIVQLYTYYGNANQKWKLTKISSSSSRLTSEGQEPSSKVQIYPNPTEKEVTISSEAKWVSLSIHDLSGNRKIIRNEYEQNSKIDVSRLSPGVYLVTVQTKSGTTKSRLIIK